MKITEKVNKKSAKKSIYTFLIFLVIIALYFEINVLVKKLNIKDIDITDEKLYSITNESKEKIANINKAVNIKLVNFEYYMDYANISDAVNLINMYKEINSNITIESTKTDDDTYPYFTVTCEGNSKSISLDDLFLYKYSTKTYAEEEYYLSEETVTNAILSVASEENKNIYFYLEKSIYPESYLSSSTFIKRVAGVGNNVKYLELSTTDAIPEDCNCLVIPPLNEDITEQEKNIINNYINNGGNIMLLEESKSLLTTGTPNFDSIMALYGFKIADGVIMEPSSENIVNNAPGFIYANLNLDNDVYKTLDQNSRLCLIDTGRIVFENEETLNNLNISYKVLAQASNEAFSRTDFTISNIEKQESEESVPNAILAAEVEKKINDNTTSKLIVYSNSIFAIDQKVLIVDPITETRESIDMIYFDDNEEVLLNSIKYLSENNNSVLIRKQHYDTIPTIGLLQDNMNIQIMFGLPMIIIVAGYIVWRVRRNKK